MLRLNEQHSLLSLQKWRILYQKKIASHINNILLFEKTAAESHRLLVEAYSQHALNHATCERWFRCFKVAILTSETKTVKTTEKIGRRRIASITGWRPRTNWKTIGRSIESDATNYFQSLTWSGKDSKRRKLGAVWIERDIKRQKTTCGILLDRFKRKSFLHRIISGDEKWVYIDNPPNPK